MNPKNRTLIIVLAVLGLVVVAGATALLLTSGDDGGDAVATTTTGPSLPGATGEAAPAETQPVEVSGTPLPALDDPSADPAVGLPLPIAAGHRFDGSAITIGGPTDGPTMYVFLAHWCPHCNAEIPELIELDDRGDLPAGLNVVGVSTAVVADRDNYPPSEWVADKGWPWDVMADDEAATAFISAGGSGFPYTVLADADGNVVARQDGSRPADEIKRWLDANVPTA